MMTLVGDLPFVVQTVSDPSRPAWRRVFLILPAKLTFRVSDQSDAPLSG